MKKAGLIISVVVILSGCKSSDKDGLIFMMSADLKESRQIMDNNTRVNMLSLKNKVTDPATADKAGIIEPKAFNMINILDDLNKFIELQNFDDHSMSLFSAEMRASASTLKNADPEAYVSLKTEISNLSSLADSFDLYKSKSLSINKNLAELAAFRISSLRNSIAGYYNNSLVDDRGHLSYDQPNILVSQNVKHLLPGEILEIYAGVGAFSWAAVPKVNVNGSDVVMENGMAVYKTVVNQPGKHTVKVSVSYKNGKGERQEAVMDVDYFVELPCGQKAN